VVDPDKGCTPPWLELEDDIVTEGLLNINVSWHIEFGWMGSVAQSSPELKLLFQKSQYFGCCKSFWLFERPSLVIGIGEKLASKS
jgi:hypothetical protein